MPPSLEPRELARCGLFGAAALLLPLLFHLVRLGHVFMPMYLPLVALAFLVRPGPAALTGLVTPLLSGVATGMPPFYPPVAVCMAVELAAMAALIGLTQRRWSRLGVYPVLLPTLLLGRVLHVALVYLFARLLELPAGFLAGLSLLGAWPGLLLMAVVIPPLVRLVRGARPAGEAAR